MTLSALPLSSAGASAPEVLAPPARSRAGRIKRGILFLVMVEIAAVMLYPFWFMISTSFHTEAQYQAGHGSSLQSWTQLNSVIPIGQELINSTLICAAAIGIIILVSTSAGFAF